MDGNDVLCNLPELADTKFVGSASPEDLFSIFEGLDAELARFDNRAVVGPHLGRKESGGSVLVFHESETELEMEPPLALPERSSKRPRLSGGTAAGVLLDNDDNNQQDIGQQRVSHITVERNRRKQMNEHLAVLRSLMPSFYVKRGDQASIIGGVIDYINELQQVLQSLEAKKQRKIYTEVVLSPRPMLLSPRVLPLSPRPKPLLSPRLNIPISPRTPQPPSPYKPRLSGSYTNCLPPSPTTSSSSSSINDSVANELAANSKSAVADVEVKLSGANLLLKTVSGRIPGQISKIVYALEELSLEILHVNISSLDETMVNSFTIKIGIECQLSAEELAHQIQQTFHGSSLLTN